MGKQKANKNNAVEVNKANAGFGTKNKKAQVKSEPQKEKLTKKQIKILISVLLIAVIISAAIITTVILVKNFNNPDLLTSDLSRYISISPEDYKGFDLNIPLDEYSESGVDRQINILLTNYKTLDKYYDGRYHSEQPLTLGDRALIYYSGYTIDSSGKRTDIDGTSNFGSSATYLEVGTGKIIKLNDDGSESLEGYFIPGFGEGLVGLIPDNYSKFIEAPAEDADNENRNRYRIMAGDIIYLTYTVDGKTVENEKIDLSRTDLDAVYGEGFAELFIGKNNNGTLEGFKVVGETVKSFTTKKSGSDKNVVYSNLVVSYAIRGGDENAYKIQVKFPASYNDKSLRGLEAYFDVYVISSVIFEVPSYDDDFVTKTLGVKAEELSSYDGETVAEKYRAKVSEEHRISIEESNEDLLISAMWSHLMEKVVVDSLPSGVVDPYYNGYINDITEMYKAYKNANYDVTQDEIAIAYLNNYYGAGIGSNEDWRAYVEALAERDATQKILFYYIIREENLLPTDEEYNKAYAYVYNEIWKEYKSSHETELIDLDGDAYDKKLKDLEGAMRSEYGEDYFREQAYYYYGARKMLTLGKRA